MGDVSVSSFPEGRLEEGSAFQRAHLVLKAHGLLQRLPQGSERVTPGAERQPWVMKWISRHSIHLLHSAA